MQWCPRDVRALPTAQPGLPMGTSSNYKDTSRSPCNEPFVDGSIQRSISTSPQSSGSDVVLVCGEDLGNQDSGAQDGFAILYAYFHKNLDHES